MKLRCKLLGHVQPMKRKRGWWSPGEQYCRVSVFATDGIGRSHAKVIGICDRCGENFTVCLIHVPLPKEL